jgi:murein DD-endopeptidase MepM/ murein hydrolase activator NlpD
LTTQYDPYPQRAAYPQVAAVPRQAAAPVARAYAPARSEFPAPAVQPGAPDGRGLRIDGLALAALIIAAFFIFQSLRDRAGQERPAAEPVTPAQVTENSESVAGDIAAGGQEAAEAAEEAAPPAPAPAPAADPWAISYPYDDYWLTQGPHGYSYGHMAIDLAAGKGEPIKSPIYGQVTAIYVDEYGNTTLVIENEVYAVTLLHGNYTVQVGQELALGDVVGSEWNNGYTLDMDGRSCRNRDCGYHTHLNVYSKVSQSNVNPLDVLR